MDAAPFRAAWRRICPVSMGAAPFPASVGGGAGPAGRPGARPPAGRRLLALGLAGAVVLAGLLWWLVAGPPAHGQASGASGGAATAAGSLPAGYRWYTRPASAAGAPGFTMAAPAGWRAHRRGATIYLRNPVSGGIIGVTLAPATAGGPVWEARMLERAALARGTFTGYRRIAITPFLVHGKAGRCVAVQLPAARRGCDGGPGGGHAGDRPGRLAGHMSSWPPLRRRPGRRPWPPSPRRPAPSARGRRPFPSRRSRDRWVAARPGLPADGWRPARSSPAGKAATRLIGRAASVADARTADTGQYQPLLCSCDQAAHGEP